MKKILIIVAVILSVFIIYLANMDKKVYYLTLGNSSNNYSLYIKNYLKNKKILEKYIDDFNHKNARITDIINDINSNKRKDITIKNALIKADLVTISLDSSDVYNKIKNNDVYDYIDDLASDLDKLLKLMRQYCKEDIVFIGIYNPFIDLNSTYINDIIEYFNKEYKDVCNKYNVIYVDVSDMKDYSKIHSRLEKVINKSVFEA